MIEHPASFQLDAQAAGDSVPSVAAHIEVCDRCRSYVETMTEEAKSFASHAEGGAFIERLDDAHRGRTLTRWSYVVLPMVAAAAVVFFLVRPPATVPFDAVTQNSERIKGKVQLAVVRERTGDQKRFAGDLAIRSGDRIRIEVAIAEPRPVVAGLLEKSGRWTVLLAPAFLEPGTHFSEHVARFDDAPMEGWILAGDPEAVEGARNTRDFARVAALVVTTER